MDQNINRLGIYVHIPFCVRKCNYCDFTSSVYDENIKQEYVECLIREIGGIEKKYSLSFDNYEVKTVYFGGGTPSTLDPVLIERILETIIERFSISNISELEVTIEINPGTADYDKLKKYRMAGFNRVSIGLQSANNDELMMLGRIHSYDEFLNTYKMARYVGFSNINVDIMTALPGQDLGKLSYTLNEVIRLSPEHISAYSLIIEKGTPFYEMYGEDGMGTVPNELERAMYHYVTEFLAGNGYDRYEISNYSKPGYESRHNSSYWTGIEYLGLGLGASSYINNVRYQNTDSMFDYLRVPDSADSIMDKTLLSMNNLMEEYMFLGLRMDQGVSSKEFMERFGKELMSVYGQVIDKLVKDGLIIYKDDGICLSDKGIDYGNYVFSCFLID